LSPLLLGMARLVCLLGKMGLGLLSLRLAHD
jgi:hypothetical protein